MTQTSFLSALPEEPVSWEPTAEAGRTRLAAFAPKAGKAYAQQRNYDFGPSARHNVSALSPWIRHRLILEEDVLRETLARHNTSAAEKFIQEVFWRAYFKGWLEHRPEVWQRYKQDLVRLVDQLEKDAGLAQRYQEAVGGQTGIACFDAWARELAEAGYLHNHARMWFASIWIFTLKLPWQLGADFFYRHLLDGDPASNTCSWRWVCGLHTPGKTYLARASNIERYTEGRFHPAGQLATEAPALTEPALPDPLQLSFPAPGLPGNRIGLLITEEDCSPEILSLPFMLQAILALSAPTARSVLPMGAVAERFAPAAIEDAARRAKGHYACGTTRSAEPDWATVLSEWSQSHQLDAIVAARLPIGPVAKRVRAAASDLTVPLVEVTRDYDKAVWPNAKRGFFGLKKKIPGILGELSLV